jgi:hypothetical protein
VDQDSLGPSCFISLVLGPLNSPLWYVPSSRYIWNSAPILFIKDIIIIRGGGQMEVKIFDTKVIDKPDGSY